MKHDRAVPINYLRAVIACGEDPLCEELIAAGVVRLLDAGNASNHVTVYGQSKRGGKGGALSVGGYRNTLDFVGQVGGDDEHFLRQAIADAKHPRERKISHD